MKKKILQTLVIAIAVIVGIGVWVWHDLNTKPANDRIQAGIKAIVAKEPSLKPAYNEALKDGVLTTLEANAILKKAEELKQ